MNKLSSKLIKQIIVSEFKREWDKAKVTDNGFAQDCNPEWEAAGQTINVWKRVEKYKMKDASESYFLESDISPLIDGGVLNDDL